MSEETRASSMDHSQHEGISKLASTDVEVLPFRCPACGGDALGYGAKIYRKAVMFKNGEWDDFGGEVVNENDVDFICWNCGHVISINGEPIRRREDMFKWLKAQPITENHGPTATPDNCISLSFTCPSCGAHDLGEWADRIERYIPIERVGYEPCSDRDGVEPYVDYASEAAYDAPDDDYRKHGFVCGKCRYQITIGDEPVETETELVKWLLDNSGASEDASDRSDEDHEAASSDPNGGPMTP